MTETDPCNDVTPPCGDCGDCALPCACDKPIEVAQLQRALEAAGVESAIVAKLGTTWCVTLHAHTRCVVSSLNVDLSLSDAIEDAIDQWWAP